MKFRAAVSAGLGGLRGPDGVAEEARTIGSAPPALAGLTFVVKRAMDEIRRRKSGVKSGSCSDRATTKTGSTLEQGRAVSCYVEMPNRIESITKIGGETPHQQVANTLAKRFAMPVAREV